MTQWAFFPRTSRITPLASAVVKVFDMLSTEISSKSNNHLINVAYKGSSSDVVLRKVRGELEAIGFNVEKGKSATDKIPIPVLFGKNGRAARSFHADAYHAGEGFVLEVEAGRAVTNYQFLKDLFEATVMVDVNYLGIAVREVYKSASDFDTVYSFLDTLYASERLKLPLKGILLIGY